MKKVKENIVIKSSFFANFNLSKVADLKLGRLIGSELHFTQDPENLDQSLSIMLSFARTDHPDYPSSLDQSVRELYSKTATKTKSSKPPKKSETKKIEKKKMTKKPDDGLTVSLIYICKLL